MAQKVKNPIPKSCQENWLEMTPDEKIKFCALCHENIFEDETNPEFQKYSTNKNINTECMRYKNIPIKNRASLSNIEKLRNYIKKIF